MTRKELDILSEKIIGVSYKISNSLGSGFLEKVYENALAYELRKANIKIEQQKSIKVYYDRMVVGSYFADLIVEDTIIIELKTAKLIDNSHLAQTLNYLKATGLNLGLIINFGNPRVEIKRVVNNL